MALSGCRPSQAGSPGALLHPPAGRAPRPGRGRARLLTRRPVSLRSAFLAPRRRSYTSCGTGARRMWGLPHLLRCAREQQAHAGKATRFGRTTSPDNRPQGLSSYKHGRARRSECDGTQGMATAHEAWGDCMARLL